MWEKGIGDKARVSRVECEEWRVEWWCGAQIKKRREF